MKTVLVHKCRQKSGHQFQLGLDTGTDRQTDYESQTGLYLTYWYTIKMAAAVSSGMFLHI